MSTVHSHAEPPEVERGGPGIFEFHICYSQPHKDTMGAVLPPLQNPESKQREHAIPGPFRHPPDSPSTSQVVTRLLGPKAHNTNRLHPLPVDAQEYSLNTSGYYFLFFFYFKESCGRDRFVLGRPGGSGKARGSRAEG
ncbi:UNVERIFIED_CONTAM: hypothetical protein K2H54_004719 [Gekko kuhli]